MNFIEKYLWVFTTLLVPFLYIVVATSFYLVLYIWKAQAYKNSKIQPVEVAAPQLRREFFYSIISLIIFTAMGFAVFLLYHYRYSQLYLDIGKYGILYFVVSILLMMFFHDMYFYWTHRLLHLPSWYQKIHTVHHLSSNPSPFTSLSFHPVEAIIQAAVLPLMVVIIPAHPFSIFIFLIFMVYKNVRGHAGYEFTTPDDRQNKRKWLQSYSIHHNQHHLYGRGNYGLYFTLWDKAMKTFRKES
jgi:sterol desaturase/sphingolipid hydroxylase (fatty acid hydroxylase superfamily)